MLGRFKRILGIELVWWTAGRTVAGWLCLVSAMLFLVAGTLFAHPSWAMTYWVSQVGGAMSCAVASGETDPGIYRTKAQGIACLSSGDTLMVKSGETITSTNNDVFNEFGAVPAGISAEQPTKILCQGDRTCTIRPSAIPAGGAVVGFRARHHIQLGALGHGFILSAEDAMIETDKAVQGVRWYNTNMTADVYGDKVIGNTIRGYNANGISSHEADPWSHRQMQWTDNIVEDARVPGFITHATHGIYLVGRDSVVARNIITKSNSGGIHGRSFALHCWHICRDNIFENNLSYVAGDYASGIVVGGDAGAENNHTIRRNVFKRLSGAGGICISLSQTGDNVKVFNNVCDGFTILIKNKVGSIGNIARNNICTSTTSCSISDVSGTLMASNNLTTAAISNFRNPENGDYALKSTATALIDQGTDVGLPFVGVTPDLGAVESFAPVSASSHSVKYDRTCVIRGNQVKCWVDDSPGQLGDGIPVSPRKKPVSLADIDNPTSVATGAFHTCALLTDKTVKCWGDNSAGQLGSITKKDFSSKPVTVSGIDSATAIAAGSYYTCARLESGQVQCWGANFAGQLGYDDRSPTVIPVPVNGITTAGIMVAGDAHTCVILEGLLDWGTIKCWGYNLSGQLGDGTTMDSSKPVTVKRGGAAKAVTTGTNHSCAVFVDETVQCWGSNSHGQLGNPNILTSSSVPVPVSVMTVAATRIMAGLDRTCATLMDGNVQCWGANGLGRPENASITDSSLRVTIHTLHRDELIIRDSIDPH